MEWSIGSTGNACSCLVTYRRAYGDYGGSWRLAQADGEEGAVADTEQALGTSHGDANCKHRQSLHSPTAYRGAPQVGALCGGIGLGQIFTLSRRWKLIHVLFSTTTRTMQLGDAWQTLS